MKPESLLGVSLELITDLARLDRLPADARVGRFFRDRRFLGSRDRRFVGDTAFAWLRHRHRVRPRWEAWAETTGPGELRALLPGGESPGTILADVLTLAADGLLEWSLPEALDAARGLPRPPLPAQVLKEPWAAGTWPGGTSARRAAEWSLPVWLADRLAEERGEETAGALARCLLEQAPVDLRVGVGWSGREEARVWLASALGEAPATTPLSPVGLRLPGRRALREVLARAEGQLEVEDEGSQLIVLALEATPPIRVIDACAGAGGKTLALAAQARACGATAPAVFACDPSEDRLSELARRARRAGLERWIEVIPLERSGPPPRLDPADLVLVDAPCSGLGTLRRNPEAKSRYGPEAIAELATLQRSILERFLPLVKPGGRLAYATCSLLAAENEEVTGRFSADHPELGPAALAWAAQHLPAGCVEGASLRLDPARSETDGYFLHVWTRRPV